MFRKAYLERMGFNLGPEGGVIWWTSIVSATLRPFALFLITRSKSLSRMTSLPSALVLQLPPAQGWSMWLEPMKIGAWCFLATGIGMWPGESCYNEMRLLLKFLGLLLFAGLKAKRMQSLDMFKLSCSFKVWGCLRRWSWEMEREKLRHRDNVWALALSTIWSQKFLWTFQVYEQIISL